MSHRDQASQQRSSLASASSPSISASKLPALTSILVGLLLKAEISTFLTKLLMVMALITATKKKKPKLRQTSSHTPTPIVPRLAINAQSGDWAKIPPETLALEGKRV